jgi:peroxiredoxin Q/BCP
MRRPLSLALAAALTVPLPAHAKMLAPGDSFPAWSLTDQTGAPVASKDLGGKSYLLWYYPKAETPGCTTEGLALKEDYEEFRARGVEIFGVSFDAPPANAKFVKVQGFPFRLLSDTDRALATQVGAAESREQPVAKRVSYLVGGDGKVIKAYPTVVPDKHSKEVLADLPPPAK